MQGKVKYILPHAASEIKTQSDQEKYDKGVELNRKIGRIRQKYEKDLESQDVQTSQHATALYFVDRLALRVGNEKTAGEADTVGCTTLRKEHIRFGTENKSKEEGAIELNFMGKDSIRYKRVNNVSRKVYRNMKEFVRGKAKDELIFDEITACAALLF